MRKRISYIIGILFIVLLSACSPSSKASRGGDVKPQSAKMSKNDERMMYSKGKNKEAQQAQLSMIERRIMYYKIRKKEAKKNKQYQQMEIYDMGLKKYQKQRRQMTTLYVRILRNMHSEF